MSEIFGQIGVLARDGDKVQCHVCGRWFRGVAAHAWQAHGLSSVEYREALGLHFNGGLVGDATRDRMRANALAHPDVIARLVVAGKKASAEMSPDVRRLKAERISLVKRAMVKAGTFTPIPNNVHSAAFYRRFTKIGTLRCGPS